jgi:hypothetical protein
VLEILYTFDPLTDYLLDVIAVPRGAAPNAQGRRVFRANFTTSRFERVADLARLTMLAAVEHRHVPTPAALAALATLPPVPDADPLDAAPAGDVLDAAFQAAGLAVPQVPRYPRVQVLWSGDAVPQPVAVVVESNEAMWRARPIPTVVPGPSDAYDPGHTWWAAVRKDWLSLARTSAVPAPGDPPRPASRASSAGRAVRARWSCSVRARAGPRCGSTSWSPPIRWPAPQRPVPRRSGCRCCALPGRWRTDGRRANRRPVVVPGRGGRLQWSQMFGERLGQAEQFGQLDPALVQRLRETVAKRPAEVHLRWACSARLGVPRGPFTVWARTARDAPKPVGRAPRRGRGRRRVAVGIRGVGRRGRVYGGRRDAGRGTLRHTMGRHAARDDRGGGGVRGAGRGRA